MNQNIEIEMQNLRGGISTTIRRSLLDVVEISTADGQWIIPAMQEVSLAMALSDFSATWQVSRGIRSESFSVGTVAICEFDRTRTFETRETANFAVVLLRNEALEQIRQENRQIKAELQAHDVLQDRTLQQLMEILVREQRQGLPSNSLFLDGIAVTLASHLMHRYTSGLSLETNLRGGLTPAILRRSIEFMEEHLENDLSLNELAREAGLSASHFLRSFRQSTGKTPYQFLLNRRVVRAQDLMRDNRTSLTEVALASGFADQHHLARVFRRMTNVTPSTYRRSLE